MVNPGPSPVCREQDETEQSEDLQKYPWCLFASCKQISRQKLCPTPGRGIAFSSRLRLAEPVHPPQDESASGG